MASRLALRRSGSSSRRDDDFDIGVFQTPRDTGASVPLFDSRLEPQVEFLGSVCCERLVIN